MRTLLILTTFVFLSCRSQQSVNTIELRDTKKSKGTLDFNVALTFINDYVLYCKTKSPPTNDTNWIRNNSLLTENFKTTYYNLINSAQKDDPELGLGFDPIFDAQDFPDRGFVIVNSNQDGYVTVKGKDWQDFMLVLKVVEENGKSLVDGCGVINIPLDNKTKR